jgi:hypothetical protein
VGCKICLALILATAAMALPRNAVADQNLKTNSIYWNLRDRCTRLAQQAYPDYTPESNAKREKMRKNCLLGNNLPSEGNSIPPQTPTSNAAPQQFECCPAAVSHENVEFQPKRVPVQ